MGIDLHLFPMDRTLPMQKQDGTSYLFGYSHTVLVLPRNYGLFDAIRALSPERLPDGHDISGLLAGRVPDGHAKDERYYGRFDRDSYGDLYTWVSAIRLGEVLGHHLPTHPVTMYVAAMDPSAMVILDWC